MFVVTILVIGLAIGALARFVMSGPTAASLLATSVLATAGALIAGVIGRAFGWYHTALALPGITASIFGAMLVLLIHRLVMRPRGA